MVTRRSYEDADAAAHALDLVGERWALLVVRELLFGAKRFTDLRAGLPGISPNVLTQRLHELEEAGVVRRVQLPMPASVWVYTLTDWGRDLEPIVLGLARWGARSPFRDRSGHLSVDSLMLSFRATFTPPGAAFSYEFRFGSDRFHVTLNGDRLDIARGSATNPDAVIEADPATLSAIIYDGRDATEAIAARHLSVRGNLAAFEHFVTLFVLPEAVAFSQR